MCKDGNSLCWTSPNAIEVDLDRLKHDIVISDAINMFLMLHFNILGDCWLKHLHLLFSNLLWVIDMCLINVFKPFIAPVLKIASDFFSQEDIAID